MSFHFSIGKDGVVETPNLLNVSIVRPFWLSWDHRHVKFGHTFDIGQEIIMQKPYPSTIDIKYLGLFNGFGMDGQWRLYTGIYSYFMLSPYFPPNGGKIFRFKSQANFLGLRMGKLDCMEVYPGFSIQFFTINISDALQRLP